MVHISINILNSFVRIECLVPIQKKGHLKTQAGKVDVRCIDKYCDPDHYCLPRNLTSWSGTILQLADVLTDSLTAEDFGPLDLSLGNMAGTGSDGRGLDESDFLNPSALSDPEGKRENAGLIAAQSESRNCVVNISLFGSNRVFFLF